MKKKLSELPRKERIYRIIFDSDTKEGKMFDLILLVVILFSIFIVMFETSQKEFTSRKTYLQIIEWIITSAFLIEYIVRIIVSPKPKNYIFSFLGFVDLMAIVPSFIAILFPGAHALVIIRAVRLLRVFRILKLYRFVKAGHLLLISLRNSFRKILIFMIFVLIIVTILGSIMYVVESGNNGFNTIPHSIYWAVITLTTVGYGDIVPFTNLGKFIATFIMLLGYSIIAIPTGIVSAEMSRGFNYNKKEDIVCDYCGETNHPQDTRFCRVCGHRVDS